MSMQTFALFVLLTAAVFALVLYVEPFLTRLGVVVWTTVLAAIVILGVALAAQL